MTTSMGFTHSLRKMLTLFLSISLIGMLLVVPAAWAGKEGVFLNDSTYFTLEEASLAPGGDTAALQLLLRLHNDGSDAVDFNNYGVRVIDDSGNSFVAELNSKQSARVMSGQDQDFRFLTQVPANDLADQLHVMIFKWDYSQANLMSDIGALSVSTAVAADTTAVRQAVLNLQKVDSTLPQDAVVSFQLGKSYSVNKDGSLSLYTDLSVKNLGSSSFSLPTGLLYRIKDAQALTYAGSIVNGADRALLPNESRKITLQAVLPLKLTAVDGLFIQFFTKNADNETVIGNLALDGSQVHGKIGEAQPYYNATGTLTGVMLTTDRAETSKRQDGLLMQTTVTVQNKDTQIAGIPALAASFQFGSDGAAIAAADNTNHPDYLSSQDSTTYHFQAVLPDGIDPNAVQLVLLNKKAASSNTANSAGNGNSTANNANTAGTNTSGSRDASTSAATTTGSATSGSTSGTSASTNTTNTTNSGTNASTNSTNTNNTNNSGTSTATSASTGYAVAITDLTGAINSSSIPTDAQSYKLGAKLILDSSNVVDKNLDVSMVELHMHANDDFGYQTAIAKFKLTNKGNTPISFPTFQTELIGASGSAYTGTRQTTVAQQIMPNTSYVFSSSYLLSAVETGDQLTMNVYDDKALAPEKLSIGMYKVSMQQEATDGVLSFYPFQVNVEDFNLSWNFSNSSYNYKLDLNLDVKLTDEVLIDQNFANIEFDLMDASNRTLSSASFPFSGGTKIISGKQVVNFSSLKADQIHAGVTVRIYETITTPNGPAKRLVKVLTPVT